MPADPHHSGAALIPSTTVGEAAGQERRPPVAANVGTCYGHVPETMTLDPRHITPHNAGWGEPTPSLGAPIANNENRAHEYSGASLKKNTQYIEYSCTHDQDQECGAHRCQ
jgi:hypothetical protein